MTRTTYIFPHIPKCAGTSIQKQLEASGLRVFFDYEAPPGLADWHKRRCERRNADFDLLDFSAFDVVFGHFPILRYQRPNYRYIAQLRDPYERAISHYAYQISRHEKGLNLDPAAARSIAQLASGEVSFATWLSRIGASQLYSLYLDRWPREKFTLVGDARRYSEFLADLGELLGISLDVAVQERPRDTSIELNISEDEEKRARALLREETEYYRSMTEA